MKALSLFSLLACLFFAACGGEKKEHKPIGAADQLNAPKPNGPETHGSEVTDVKLSNPLDQAMVTSGKETYELKCAACHKLTDQRLVGPGWSGVTKRRQPLWIMNMTTNVDMMLEKDSTAQALLEQCLVRMPNQNVTEADARSLLEFMRKNDGEK